MISECVHHLSSTYIVAIELTTQHVIGKSKLQICNSMSIDCMSSANIVAIKLSTNPHIDGRSIDTLIALLIVCLIQILWLAINSGGPSRKTKVVP